MRLKKTIKRIQKSDESTRQLWLWLLTISSGLVIVLLWLVYINASIDRIGSADGRPHSSFFSTFNAGLLSIREQAVEGIRVLMREKSYSIEIPQKTFVYGELEKIPKIQLP